MRWFPFPTSSSIHYVHFFLELSIHILFISLVSCTTSSISISFLLFKLHISLCFCFSKTWCFSKRRLSFFFLGSSPPRLSISPATSPLLFLHYFLLLIPLYLFHNFVLFLLRSPEQVPRIQYGGKTLAHTQKTELKNLQPKESALTSPVSNIQASVGKRIVINLTLNIECPSITLCSILHNIQD